MEGDNIGGVPLRAFLDCLTLVGSVVRRVLDGWTATLVGVEAGGEVVGEETSAVVELEGLSDVRMLKAALLGEFGLDDECACRLFLNCCRPSSVPRC